MLSEQSTTDLLKQEQIEKLISDFVAAQEAKLVLLDDKRSQTDIVEALLKELELKWDTQIQVIEKLQMAKETWRTTVAGIVAEMDKALKKQDVVGSNGKKRTEIEVDEPKTQTTGENPADLTTEAKIYLGAKSALAAANDELSKVYESVNNAKLEVVERELVVIGLEKRKNQEKFIGLLNEQLKITIECTKALDDHTRAIQKILNPNSLQATSNVIALHPADFSKRATQNISNQETVQELKQGLHTAKKELISRADALALSIIDEDPNLSPTASSKGIGISKYRQYQSSIRKKAVFDSPLKNLDDEKQNLASRFEAEAKLSEMQKKLSGIELKNAALEQEIFAEKASVEAAETLAKNYRVELEAEKQKGEEVQALLDSALEKITVLEIEKKQYDAEISAKVTAIQEANQQTLMFYEQLKAEGQEKEQKLTRKINQLKQENKAQDDRIATLEEENDDLKYKVEDLEAKLEDLEKEAEELKEELQAQQMMTTPVSIRGEEDQSFRSAGSINSADLSRRLSVVQQQLSRSTISPAELEQNNGSGSENNSALKVLSQSMLLKFNANKSRTSPFPKQSPILRENGNISGNTAVRELFTGTPQ